MFPEDKLSCFAAPAMTQIMFLLFLQTVKMTCVYLCVEHASDTSQNSLIFLNTRKKRAVQRKHLH